MDEHREAVRALRRSASVESREKRTELSAAEWPDEPTDGWVGVGAIVLSPERDAVVLVRNWWSGERWVFPGGSVEPTDDSLRAAVRREVREETGLSVTVERPLLIEAQTYVRSDAAARSFEGWFVLFQAQADGLTIADSPGEGPDEITAVSWFETPPETLLDHAEFVRTALE